MSAIDALFRPASIAVVGATPDETKSGGRCILFLKKFGYPGTLYPINPKYDTILDLPAYPDLASLPGPVDLVVVMVGAAAVAGSLRAAAKAGARAVIVCASGFAEAGPEGRKLQDEIVAIARETGLAIVGPNSLGIIDLHSRVTATFSTGMQGGDDYEAGPIGFVSQSGAMGAIVMRLALNEQAGFGKMVSTGNEAVLEFADFLNHFAEDDDIEVVLGYVEGIGEGRGRDFVAAARRAHEAGKTVGILKVGHSDAGRQAARSHTGALVGSAKVYDAAFRRSGVHQVDDVRGLLDLALARPAKNATSGASIGIVSMSGGAAVLMADQLSTHGLSLGALSDATRDALAKVLPEFSGMSNPVDCGAVYSDPNKIEACVAAVAADPGIDLVMVFIGLAPQMAGVIEDRLARVRERHGKPIIVAWLGVPSGSLQRLRSLNVAAYDEIGRSVSVAAQLVQAGRPIAAFRDTATRRENEKRAANTRLALNTFVASGRTTLTEREVKSLLTAYGIPVVPEELARNTKEAEAIAARFSGLLAIKAEAPELLHKSDSGAVRLRVAPQDAGKAFLEVVEAAAAVVGRAGVTGAVIQPMAEPGLEILAGLRLDPQFGPVVSVGLGGVTSEVLADVATELAPVDLELAHAMISRLRGSALLGAFRGEPSRDVDALAKLIVDLSEFGMEAGSLVSELDLNPVLVHAAGRGCTVVDGAAVLAQPSGR